MMADSLSPFPPSELILSGDNSQFSPDPFRGFESLRERKKNGGGGIRTPDLGIMIPLL